jgi:hypothetical protein
VYEPDFSAITAKLSTVFYEFRAKEHWILEVLATDFKHL